MNAIANSSEEMIPRAQVEELIALVKDVFGGHTGGVNAGETGKIH